MALSSLLEPTSFADMPGWADDDHASALLAFRRTASEAGTRRYRTGGLGIGPEALTPAFHAASTTVPHDARTFFEQFFTPHRIRPDGAERGFVTGYYEPIVAASRRPTARFPVPLYRPPADLVKVTDDSRPPHLAHDLAFAQATPDGLREYPDRQAIESGLLQGQDLEIAWLADRVEAFFIHVQGCARLRFEDGTEKRVTYAAKSGHPFTGPGRLLADLGEMPREAVTMQSIRAWFRQNPERIDEILHQNRSFIFFREAPVGDEALGPIAAAKVPLQAGRSLAVDRLLHTFGSPLFVAAEGLAHEERAFRRLMIAQDTGSAIVGPARGDIFFGSGDAAGEVAGTVKHAADFFLLVPRALVAGDGR
ncbi:MAG: murein transglycosylase A [Rhizobiaceae bacterium]